MRLDKFLADMGAGTRSELKKAIRKSRITVDGRVERDPGAQVSEESCVCFDGEEIRYMTLQYYMLHKPAGLLSASEDRRQRTVVDLIAERSAESGTELVRRDLFPVGRLDKDTEGILIITNDGALAHRLLAPKHHIDKTYYAVVTGTITEEDQRAFESGICYDEHLRAMPAKLRILSTGKTVREVREALGFPACLPPRALQTDSGNDESAQPAWTEDAALMRLLRTRLSGEAFLGAEEAAELDEETLVSEVEITLQEGKFHQIKKMVRALPGDQDVVYLRRVSMGPLLLDPALLPGDFRPLTEAEITALKSCATNNEEEYNG